MFNSIHYVGQISYVGLTLNTDFMNSSQTFQVRIFGGKSRNIWFLKCFNFSLPIFCHI